MKVWKLMGNHFFLPSFYLKFSRVQLIAMSKQKFKRLEFYDSIRAVPLCKFLTKFEDLFHFFVNRILLFSNILIRPMTKEKLVHHEISTKKKKNLGHIN